MIYKKIDLRIYTNIAASFFCCLATAFYFLMTKNFTVVYWYDAHIRLALRDQVLLGHWLPLIQILIVVVSKFTNDLLILRTLLAIIAGCTLLCVYIFVRRLFSLQIALIATVFLATNLMFVALAIVPYPEVLFIGLLFITLNLVDDSSSGKFFYLGIVALNLACLTRYEGWLLAGIFVIEAAWEFLQTKKWKRFFQVTFLSSVVPLGWLIFGISGSGSLLDRLKAIIAFEIMTDTESLGARFLAHLNGDYLIAFASNYYHLLSWQAGIGIILLGVFGWLYALLFAEHRSIHGRILAFVILDWLLLALWQPWDFSNLRTAFIGQVFLVLYAAYGLQQLIHYVFQGLTSVLRNKSLIDWQHWYSTPLMLAIAYYYASSAVEFVKVTSLENDFSNPAQVGAWLKLRLEPSDGFLLLTDDVFQPYAFATYTGLPYNNIIDDRFDSNEIASRLVPIEVLYVVESYRMRKSLSAEETNLLTMLEDETIHAQLFTVGIARVWLIAKNEVNKLKAIYG